MPPERCPLPERIIMSGRPPFKLTPKSLYMPNTPRSTSPTRLFTVIITTLFATSAFLYQMYLAPRAQAVSTSIVISQVYGGGGNSGATYQNDFVELFNRGT